MLFGLPRLRQFATSTVRFCFGGCDENSLLVIGSCCPLIQLGTKAFPHVKTASRCPPPPSVPFLQKVGLSWLFAGSACIDLG